VIKAVVNMVAGILLVGILLPLMVMAWMVDYIRSNRKDLL